MWKLFRNRRVEWFEDEFAWMIRRHTAEILRLADQHEKEIERVQALHTTLEYEAMRERVELKNAHAAELKRVIEENQKLRDDMDRLRLLVTPALQNVELPKERSAPQPPNEDTPVGTPWMRVRRQAIAEQEEAAKRRLVKPVAAPLEGDPNGVSSERRVDAPLGGESKPA
jgi:hypothetical protein